jgi:hypothetical protein
MSGRLGALAGLAMVSACYNPYPDNPPTGGAGAAGAGDAGGGGSAPGFCATRLDTLFCADFDQGGAPSVEWDSWAETAPAEDVSLELVSTWPSGSAPHAARTAVLGELVGGGGGAGGAGQQPIDAKLLKAFTGSLSEFHLELDVLADSSTHFAGVIRTDANNKNCVVLVRVDADKLILNFTKTGGGGVDARTAPLLSVPGEWARVEADVDLTSAGSTFGVKWNGKAYTAAIAGNDMPAWEAWRTACGGTATPNTFRLELGPHYALPSTSFSFDNVVFDKIR